MNQKTRVLNLMHDAANANAKIINGIDFVRRHRGEETDTQLLDRLLEWAESGYARSKDALDSYYVWLKDEKII